MDYKHVSQLCDNGHDMHDSDDTPTPSIPPNAARTAMATARHLPGLLDRSAHTLLSDDLRVLLPALEEHTERDARLADVLPPVHQAIFRNFSLLPIGSPSSAAVPADSSMAMYARLRAVEVETVLRIAEGSEPSFDLKGGAEEDFSGLFDEAVEFPLAALGHA
ncbi:hypothetical protein V8E53_006837 [Lactarius tabidus]